ncbi:choice-of-anchor J domain-containing protein [Mangrovimonas sp. TPBH4]|uniref:T9SS-dependent choice-of-anchor J family protein n=1 Tax=Mangrovimonas sp. TPBH4 TaxID=1645914 RepID=UPI0006B56EFC|nr:choice-of-anchor J domain-containing protein [Mangrovimonas sp. TPBH4]
MKKITLWLFALCCLGFSLENSAQITEGFETDPPSGWTFMQTEGDDPGFVQTSSRANTGTYSYYHNDDNISVESTSWMISPAYSVSTGDIISFYYNQTYPSYSVESGVWISTSSGDPVTNPSDFTEIYDLDANFSENLWTEFSLNLDSYAGQTVYIAFKYVGDWADELYIDDFFAGPAPSCLEPLDMTATSVTSSTANLEWSAGGSEISWNLEWKAEANFSPGNGEEEDSANATESPVYNAINLQPYTTYYVYYQADCGEGDLSSWSGPYAFTTACEAIDSFSENFDLVSTPDLPACWSSVIDNGASSYATVGTSTSADNTEPNGVSLYNSSSTSETNIMLVSPVLSNLGAGTHQLRFFARNSSSTQDIEVGTIADPSDGSTFTVLETIDLTTTFDEYVVYFDEYVGTDTYIAIRRLSTSTYTYVYIDDMIWEPIPSCIPVSDLSVSGITSTSANLSWMENGDASIYNVEVVLEGGTATGTPTDIGVTNGFTKSDLIPFTEYDFYVQADCESDGTSSWAGPYTFSTLPIAPENDDCSGAIALTVNEDLECTIVTNGTTLGATESAQEDDVTGTPNTDVWFSFVATYPAHEIEISNVENQGGGTSTSVDMGMAVYDATAGCEALVFVDDSDPNNLILEGLDVGTTYYVRVYGWYGTIQYNNFDICVGTLPCLEGEASGTIVANCDNGEFSIEVEVTDQGDILHLSDGTTAIDVTGSGTYTFGPYISGSEVDIDAIHTDEYCDFEVGSYDYTCPPDNDLPSTAIALTLDIGTSCGDNTITEISNVAATDSGVGTPSCGDYDGGDLWYTIEAPAEGFILNVSNVSGLTSVAGAIYSGTPDDFTELDCTEFSSGWPWEISGLTVGEIYYLKVYDYGNDEEGTFNLCGYYITCTPANIAAAIVPDCDNNQFYIDVAVTEFGDLTSLSDGNQEQTISESQPFYNFGPYPNGTEVTISAVHSNTDCNFELDSFNYSCPPVNDECEGAVVINVDAGYCDGINNNGDNTGATDSGLGEAECFDYGENDVWFSFTVPEGTSSVNISTDFTGGTNVDTEIAVYSGDCGALVEEDCDNDGGTEILSNGSSWNSFIEDFEVNVGETYFVRVSGYNSSRVGTFCLEVSTNETLGINDFNEALNSITYFPNPVNDKLSIRSQHNMETIIVVNMLGQEVMKVAPNSVSSDVEMSQLQSGAYFVKVIINSKTEIIRIIKR